MADLPLACCFPITYPLSPYRLQYEASFVYDLMEWVHPGTIHKYAKADQKSNNLKSSPVAATTTTVANAGGRSSSLKAGGPLGEDEG